MFEATWTEQDGGGSYDYAGIVTGYVHTGHNGSTKAVIVLAAPTSWAGTVREVEIHRLSFKRWTE